MEITKQDMFCNLFKDVSISALLNGSTRRKCLFPKIFTMPFLVSGGNTKTVCFSIHPL